MAMEAPVAPNSAVIAPENTRFVIKNLGASKAFNDANQFEITLENIKTQEYYGSIEFEIAKPSYTNSYANILELHVNRNHRNKRYGSTLLKLALEKIRAEKIESAHLIAEPSDFDDGECEETMLPKLIRFYERHGGTVIGMYNEVCASMMFDLKEKQSGQ
jgi:ribosomal protein S18 acetylase RimI-like enzyme